MKTRSDQPWVKWVERKIKKLKERWKIEDNIFEVTPNKKRMKELKEECIVESMMKVWYEGEERPEENMKKQKERRRRRKM